MNADRHPKKILIIRPSALGDVCRSVPVLVSLRRAYPKAKIDWLVQDTFAAAIAAHPMLIENSGEVVSFPRTKFRAWYTPSVAPQLKGFLASLRDRQYDLVLDCQGLFRSGVFALATGAPVRIGFENADELGWLGLTKRVKADKSMHAVDRMLLLAQAAGAEPVADMQLYTAGIDRVWCRAHDVLGASDRYAVLAPTTRWRGKLWPEDRFVELARILLDEHALGIKHLVIVGSEHEREQIPQLLALAQSQPRMLDLVGKTTVGQMMSVIEGSSLLVGCDSAAVHMAVGYRRPLVALYGPTVVERVGPYGRSDCVIQRVIPGDVRDHKDTPAGQRLMNRITVDEVFALAGEQLRK